MNGLSGVIIGIILLNHTIVIGALLGCITGKNIALKRCTSFKTRFGLIILSFIGAICSSYLIGSNTEEIAGFSVFISIVISWFIISAICNQLAINSAIENEAFNICCVANK